MKNKLKIIIPVGIALIAIALAFVFIRFTPEETADYSAVISTAQQYLIDQKYEQAIAEFEKAIQIDPRNVDAYIGIAQAYEAVGDTESALEWLQKGYDLTGDTSLKEEIDRLSVRSAVAETSANAGENITVTETSDNIPEYTELKWTYADDWYSIFKYDSDGNIVNMSLFNKDGVQRLNADYEYIGDEVTRTVYVDGNLYEKENIEFKDYMAEAEAEKKERANKRIDEYNNWYIYDENGDLIEQGWYNLDQDGNTTQDSGGIYYYKNNIMYKFRDFFPGDYGWDLTTYYDEKGYPQKQEGINFDYDTYQEIYTYEYDEYGYPVVQYTNGEKSAEYVNFYKDGEFVYCATRDFEFYDPKYQITHQPSGDHYISDNRNNFTVYYFNDMRNIWHNTFSSNVHIYYYVPSLDGEKIIDCIYIDDSKANIEGRPLFECPYCYD